MMGCATSFSSLRLSSNSSTSASWLLSSQEMASSTTFSILSLSSGLSFSATCVAQAQSVNTENAKKSLGLQFVMS